ncbi:MAG: GDSL-type esterase/lipase family protein [Candidatus Omnitrophota bacterium]|nr:GDSL-type esterase/lipase family protein [Candidatus Omnitrophota bacterium]
MSCGRSSIPLQKPRALAWGASLFFCVFFVFMAAGCAKREVKNIDSKGKNIICFGDSITFGYGVKPGEDYPTNLAELVSYPVINAGIDGDSSPEALQRLEADILQRHPLLVIIEFGGNDFLRKIPLDVTAGNIRKMVRRIQERGGMAAIADISAGLFMREYRQALHKVAREEGAIFIPSILSGIVTNPSMKSDFLHPNAQGYTIVARRIWRFIDPYLKKNARSRENQPI